MELKVDEREEEEMEPVLERSAFGAEKAEWKEQDH